MRKRYSNYVEKVFISEDRPFQREKKKVGDLLRRKALEGNSSKKIEGCEP